MKYYIVKEPFNGSIESEIYTDKNGIDKVQYSGYLYNSKGEDLTVIEYLKLDNKKDSYVISSVDLDVLIVEHEKSLITDFKKISSERFFDMLEILPPCKWGNISGVEMFHVSERHTGDLVSWFFNYYGDYYEKLDYSKADRSLLAKQLKEVK